MGKCASQARQRHHANFQLPNYLTNVDPCDQERNIDCMSDGTSDQCILHDENDENDKRKRIYDLSNCSQNCIGLISCGSKYGTGFLVDQDIVLTCAHVIFSQNQSKRKMTFTLKLDGRPNSSEKYDVLSVLYPKQYKQFINNHKQQIKYDFGVLILKDKVPNSYKIPKFSIKQLRKQDFLKIVGYPRQTKCGVRKVIQETTGKCDKVYKQFIYNKIPTVLGYSGSPIFFKNQIVGIHIGGSPNLKTNYGLLITQRVKKNFSEMTKELKIKKRQMLQNNVKQKEESLQRVISGGKRQKYEIFNPSSAIGMIKSTFENEEKYGTGFLIQKNIVLTTASNCIIKQTRQEPKQTVFILLNGKQPQHYHVKCKVSNTSYFENEKSEHSRPYNYAILILFEEIQNVQPVKVDVSENNLKQKLQIWGFSIKGEFAKFEGSLVLKNKEFLRYKVETRKGFEGSPIMNKEQRVVGMHIEEQNKERKIGFNLSEETLHEIELIKNKKAYYL